jgi:branched-chain amino acid transport system permease protein
MMSSCLIVVVGAVLVGLPSLRLRDDYFAIATLGLAESVRYIAQNATSLTGGNQGTFALEIDSGRSATASWLEISAWIRDTALDPIGLGSQEFALLPLLLLTALVATACAVVLTLSQRTPWGRVLHAVRDDEQAARAVGKPVFWYKLQSLLIAAVIGGIAGWMLVLYLDSASPESFDSLFTFVGYTVLVLAGTGRYFAVILSAAAVWTLLEGVRFLDLPLEADKVAALRFVVVGLTLLLLIELRATRQAVRA